jgi:hypothetical protein
MGNIYVLAAGSSTFCHLIYSEYILFITYSFYIGFIISAAGIKAVLFV